YAGLQAGEIEPQIVIGANDRRTTLAEPVFVARREELSRIQEHVDRLHAGRGGFIFVEAESGGGKSRILSEVSRHAAGHGLRVFKGQVSSDVVQRPFLLLDGVVNGILKLNASNREFSKSFKQRLDPDWQLAITTALPSL